MNKNFYSPTMLTKYINCKHIISNEHHEEKLKIQRKERTITDELRIEKGLDHEVSYFEELKKKYSKVKNIKSLNCKYKGTLLNEIFDAPLPEKINDLVGKVLKNDVKGDTLIKKSDIS